MGDSKERKQYSRRIRTPKKFFDFEQDGEADDNDTNTGRKKRKSGGSAGQKDSTMKAATADVEEVEERSKKSRKKSFASRKDKEKTTEIAGDIQDTVGDKSQKKSDIDLKSMKTGEPEESKSSPISDSKTKVEDRIKPGETRPSKTSNRTETVKGSRKRKGTPRKSLAENHDSFQSEKSGEEKQERITADASEVSKVKTMVDSLRSGDKSLRNSPTPDCVEQSVFTNIENKSKVLEDVSDALVKKEKDLELQESDKINDKTSRSSELHNNIVSEAHNEISNKDSQKHEGNKATPSFPKKRGRKKKSETMNNSITMETSQLDESTTESNLSIKEKNTTDDADQPVSTNFDKFITPSKVTPGKSKPGRKKKVVVDEIDKSVTEEPSPSDNVVKSRSGRKRKAVDYSAMDKHVSDDDDETKDEKETPKRKRGRRSTTTATPDEADADSEPVKKGRGRGRKSKLVKDTPDKEDLEELKCWKCDDFTAKFASEFQKHMAITHQFWWTKENPEGCSDRKSLGRIMKLRKFLNCSKCDKRLNHLQYYEHHMEWCGREEETYQCEMCGSLGLKLMWKKLHLQQCPRVRAALHEAQIREQQEKRAELEKKGEVLEEAQNGEKGSRKRGAAKRALTMLQDLSKDSTDETDIHSDDSEGDPDAVFNEKDAEDDEEDDEIDDEEVEDEIDDDYNEGDEEDDNKSKKYSYKQYGGPRTKGGFFQNYFNTYDLTKQFIKENLSTELFTSWLPRQQDWVAVSESECEKYLPQASSSVEFRYSNKQRKQTLQLYEAKKVSGSPVFFTGLFIWKLAWCPVPSRWSNSADQYLVVTGKLGPNDGFYADKRYSGPACIQLWNAGVVNNSKTQRQDPSLCFSIIHDYGHVTESKWCPSGCYQNASLQCEEGVYPRLGLLAVSCTDGTIRIFSVPQPSALPTSDNQAPPVYKPAPVVTLVPTRSWGTRPSNPTPGQKTRLEPTCSCFDWSSIKGHSKIVAGYSDGTVRLFNLATSSELLIIKQPGPILTILPHHRCQPMGCLVRSIRFVAQTENRIALGDEEFETFFLDLDSGNCPFYIDIPTSMTVALTTGLWHHGVFQACDDNYAVGFNRSRYIESASLNFYAAVAEKAGQRKPEVLVFNVASQSACIWDVSVSNWINYVVTADNKGTICGMPLQDMTLHQPDVKVYKFRQTLLTTSVIEEKCENPVSKKSDKQSESDNSDKSGEKNPVSADLHTQTDDKSPGDTTPASRESKNEDTTVVKASSKDVRSELNTSIGRVRELPKGGNDGGISVAMVTGEAAAAVRRNLDYENVKSNVHLQYNEHVQDSVKGPVLDPVNDNHSRFPIAALTTIALNPNQHQCLWMVYAGQSGLVRLVNLHGIMPKRLKLLLPKVDPALAIQTGRPRNTGNPKNECEESRTESVKTDPNSPNDGVTECEDSDTEGVKPSQKSPNSDRKKDEDSKTDNVKAGLSSPSSNENQGSSRKRSSKNKDRTGR